MLFLENLIKNCASDYILFNLFIGFLIYECCGYVLKVLFHCHCDKNNYEKESHGVIVVKDINCLEPISYVVDMNNIEIIETTE